MSQYYYRRIGFLSSWISAPGASSVLAFSLTIVSTHNTQILVNWHGHHIAMGFLKPQLLHKVRIRPAQGQLELIVTPNKALTRNRVFMTGAAAQVMKTQNDAFNELFYLLLFTRSSPTGSNQ